MSTRGVTLAELMVVIIILGLMAGVVGLSLRPAAARDAGVKNEQEIAAARHQALRSGRTVRIQMTIDGRSFTVAALPDGRVLAPTDLRVDALTGAVR